MKSSKMLRKIMMMTLAVMLVFAMSLPVAAQDYFTTTDGSYIQGTAPTYQNQTIYVDMVIESRTISGDYIYETIENVPLTAGGTAESFYVLDVLLAVQNIGDYTFNDASGNPLDANDSYFYSVTDEDTSATYGPTSQYAWDGWVFRIDGQFPLESAGWGASIATAYVTNGDTINLYHDDVSSSTACADFAKITSVNVSGSTMTVNVKASWQYYGPAPNYDWTLADFTNYSGVTVNVCTTTGTVLRSGTTDASGNATINVQGLRTGNCIVQVQRTTFASGLIQNTTDEVLYVLQ